MKYFILEQGKEYDRNPQIKEWYGRLDLPNLRRKGFHTKERLMFDITTSEFTFMGDIMVNPCLMISEALRDIMFLYEKHIIFKEVFFMDNEKEKGYVYYIPFIPTADCLMPSSILTADKRKLETGVVSAEKLWNRHIVEAEGLMGQCVLVSLDLAESILRKGLLGIGLREVMVV